MVCDPAFKGTDVRNRGIGRARIFVGEFLLFAAVILWATSVLMSPHGSATVEGSEHVRMTVASFLQNSAYGTLVLAALSGWLLFPPRRPRRPFRDRSLLGVIAVLAATAIYQLIWLRTAVFDSVG
jgi:drug/metabolite transporter (DMT)-like permease